MPCPTVLDTLAKIVDKLHTKNGRLQDIALKFTDKKFARLVYMPSQEKPL